MTETNRQIVLEFVSCPLCASPQSRFLTEKNGFKIVRCPSCGLVYVNPRVANPEVLYDRSYYEGKGVDRHVNYLEESVNADPRFFEFVDIVRNVNWMASGTRFLDCGGGVGLLLSVLHKVGKMSVALDVSEWACNYVAKCGFLAVAGNGDVLPFQDGCFNGVFLVDVIEHLRNPMRTLAEINRVLCDGGVLFLQTGGDIMPIIRSGKVEDAGYIMPEIHLTYFCPSTLLLALSKTGFKWVRGIWQSPIILRRNGWAWRRIVRHLLNQLMRRDLGNVYAVKLRHVQTWEVET